MDKFLKVFYLRIIYSFPIKRVFSSVISESDLGPVFVRTTRLVVKDVTLEWVKGRVPRTPEHRKKVSGLRE